MTLLQMYWINVKLGFWLFCKPGCSWRTSKREPVDWPKETISRLLEKNLIPVLHGDCCIDESSGICVLSGDTVIKVSQIFCKKITVLTQRSLFMSMNRKIGISFEIFFLLLYFCLFCYQFKYFRNFYCFWSNCGHVMLFFAIMRFISSQSSRCRDIR